MKYVYYGNYAEYLEVARVELFRELGMPYDQIEKNGIWLPVSELTIKYIKPGLYDQILDIHTFIRKKPGVRIEFDYEIYNDAQQLITTAKTTLFFLDAKTGKILRCPDFLMEILENNWNY